MRHNAGLFCWTRWSVRAPGNSEGKRKTAIARPIRANVTNHTEEITQTGIDTRDIAARVDLPSYALDIGRAVRARAAIPCRAFGSRGY